MPHLKIRGIEKNLIVENSKEIIDGLTEIIGCDRTWFARDEKIKKDTADFLTKLIKRINNNKDCCIIFFTLTGDNYCDNGEFF